MPAVQLALNNLSSRSKGRDSLSEVIGEGNVSAMRLNRFALATMLSSSVLASSLSATSVAAETKNAPNVPACTATDLKNGYCLPTGFEEGAESPVRAAVAGALRNGDLQKASNFVKRRAALANDADQIAIDKMVRDAAKGIEVSADAARVNPSDSETEYQTSGMTVAAARDGQGGTYSDSVLKAYRYGYCSSSCTYPTRMQFEFRYNIFDYPRVVLSGDIYVVEGQAMTVSEIRCRTRENKNNTGDKTWNTWSNCSDAQKGSPSTQWLILDKSWNHTGPTDKTYHNDYMVKVAGYGGSWSYTWESRDYKKVGGLYWEFLG